MTSENRVDALEEPKEEIFDLPSEQFDELRELQTELVNLNTKLVFSVATCDCKYADDCDLYKNSKEIAKVLKKMQDMIMVSTTKKPIRKRRK